MSTHFTPEQMELLRSNIYTAEVTENTLRHTLAFKEYALKAYTSGLKPREIYINAGYDPAIVGTKRMSITIRRYKQQAASPRGLRPAAAERKASKNKQKEKTIKSLNKRIEQLEDEVELLKKSYLLKMKYLKKD